jgi:hypothetical protein
MAATLSSLYLLLYDLGPHFPKYFLCDPSHRIFGRMYESLNVGKTITSCTVCL